MKPMTLRVNVSARMSRPKVTQVTFNFLKNYNKITKMKKDNSELKTALELHLVRFRARPSQRSRHDHDLSTRVVIAEGVWGIQEGRFLIATKHFYERDLRGRGRYQDDGESTTSRNCARRTGSGYFLTPDSAAYAFVCSLVSTRSYARRKKARPWTGSEELLRRERMTKRNRR